MIQEIQRQKPKIPLLIEIETGGFTINEKEQAEIIATHFKKQYPSTIYYYLFLIYLSLTTLGS